MSPIHDNHPVLMTVTPLLAAWHFLATGFALLATYGLNWQSAAALLAGAGSVLIGLAAVSRELRAWLDRRVKRKAAAAPGPHP